MYWANNIALMHSLFDRHVDYFQLFFLPNSNSAAVNVFPQFLRDTSRKELLSCRDVNAQFYNATRFSKGTNQLKLPPAMCKKNL